MSAVGQSNSSINNIRRLSYIIDTTHLRTETFKLKLDTIDISIKYSSSKIETSSYFQKSNNTIRIDYYFKNKNLILIRTSEDNPFYKGWKCVFEYYFSKSKIIKQDYTSRGPFHCIGYTLKDLEKMGDCHSNLNAASLKNYSLKLIEEIKEFDRKKYNN